MFYSHDHRIRLQASIRGKNPIVENYRIMILQTQSLFNIKHLNTYVL